MGLPLHEQERVVVAASARTNYLLTHSTYWVSCLRVPLRVDQTIRRAGGGEGCKHISGLGRGWFKSVPCRRPNFKMPPVETVSTGICEHRRGGHIVRFDPRQRTNLNRPFPDPGIGLKLPQPPTVSLLRFCVYWCRLYLCLFQTRGGAQKDGCVDAMLVGWRGLSKTL